MTTQPPHPPNGISKQTTIVAGLGAVIILLMAVFAIGLAINSSSSEAEPTDLTVSRDASTITVMSSTGHDATILAADVSTAGSMTAQDKRDLDLAVAEIHDHHGSSTPLFFDVAGDNATLAGDGERDTPYRVRNPLTHDEQVSLDRLPSADEIQGVIVVSDTEFENVLTNQADADTSLLVHCEMPAQATISGHLESCFAGDIRYYQPRTTAGERWFNLVDGSGVPNDAMFDRSTGNVSSGLFTLTLWNILTQGDRLLFQSNITSSASLGLVLSSQRTQDRPVLFVAEATISGEIGGQNVLFPQGFIGLIPPRTTDPLRIETVLNPATWMYFAEGHWGNLDITPGNITAADQVQRDYQITLSGLPVERLKALRVNYFEVWFATHAIHAVSGWTPAGSAVFTANVNEVEARTIGLTTEKQIPVLVVFRHNESGSQIFRGQVGGILTIGGEDVTPGDTLSFQDKVALTGPRLSPPSVLGGDSAHIQRSYSLLFANASALPDAFVEVSAAGQPVLARTAWSQGNITFTINDTVATAISNNLTGPAFRIDVAWYDAASGGNLVGVLRVQVPVIGRLDVRQPAVAGGDSAGVASLTLPANYDTYQELTLTMWIISDDRVANVTIPTAVLAAQTAAQNIVYATRANRNNSMWLTWTPSTRVLVDGAQSGGGRIIYASLSD